MPIIPLEQLPKAKSSTVIPIDQLPDKQSVASQVGQSFVDAGKEVVRGVNKGTSNVLSNMDMAAKGIGKLTGLGSSGTFGQAADTFAQAAENVPASNMNSTVKAVYNLVGEAGPALAEFAMVRKSMPFLNPVQTKLAQSMGDTPRAVHLASSLTDSAAMAVQGAVNTYRSSGGDIKQSIKGAGNAGALGLALPLGAEAIKVTKNLGVNAGRAFIEFVTDNPKLAKDFTENMWKYNTNPFGQVKSPQEVSQLNDVKLKTMKQENSKAEFAMQTKHQQEKHSFDSKLNEVTAQAKEANRVAKEAASEGRATKLASTVESSKAALAKTRDAIDTSLYGHATHAVEYLSTKKENLGNFVDEAVKNVVNKDPGALVERVPLMDNFKKTLNDNGFRLESGVVRPKAGASIQGVSEATNTLQAIHDEMIQHFDHPSSPTGIPLDYLQSLKQTLQKVAYDGPKNSSTNVLKQLSGALNPVNYTDNVIGRNVEKELSQLKSANKDFSTFKKSHDEAIDLLTTTDAQGKPVADTNRIMGALKSGDRKVQVLLARADQALPESLKIRPQLDKTLRTMSEAETAYTSKVKNMRRVLANEKKQLEAKVRLKEREIRLADSDKKFTKSQSLRNELEQFRTREGDKIGRLEQSMKDDEEFLTQQHSLRKLFAAGRAGGAQVGGLMGAVGGGATAASTGNIPSGILAGVGGATSVAVSPIVASNLVKGANVAGRITNLVSQTGSVMLKSLLESRLAKAVVASKSGKHEN